MYPSLDNLYNIAVISTLFHIPTSFLRSIIKHGNTTIVQYICLTLMDF